MQMAGAAESKLGSEHDEIRALMQMAGVAESKLGDPAR